jgi:hypothetical protein
MPQTIDRGGARTRGNAPRRRRRHGGPVVLATFASAPFEPHAVRVAVQAAADMSSALAVCDVVEVKPGRRGARGVTDAVAPAQAAALAAIAELARDLGVPMEPVHVSGLRPVGALLALVAERRPALLVLGTDPAALRRFRRPTRRQYRRFMRALAEQAPCLLWTAQEPVAGAASSAASPSSRARPAPIRRARPGSARTMPSPISSQIPTTNGKRS